MKVAASVHYAVNGIETPRFARGGVISAIGSTGDAARAEH
jgi:hypothetical protein